MNSLRDFLTILFKHKLKIITSFVAIVVFVAVVSFLITPTYEAKSSFLVKFGREYVYRPEVGSTEMIAPDSFNRDEAINSEFEILTSRDLIRKVIESLGVEYLYPELAAKPPGKMSPLEAAVLRFEKSLLVERAKKANVIHVYFQHRDPRVAANTLNHLVELYREKHIKVFSGPKSSFLEKQLEFYKRKLAESEDKLEAYRRKYRVFSLNEQRSLLLKQRIDLDTSLRNAQTRIEELQQKISSLKNQMRMVSENIPLTTETEQHKIIDDAKAKLLALQLREQELLGKYKETNRLLVNVRKEIRLVKDFLDEQEEKLKGKVTTGKNVVYQEMEMELYRAKTELSSLVAKAASIREQLDENEKKIQELDSREKELKGLKREVAANEKNYQTYMAKLEEARISDEMNRMKMANISVIQKAVVPSRPIKPRKGVNMIFGVLLGASFSLGLAFVAERASQDIATPQQAEKRLNLPVLATISMNPDYAARKFIDFALLRYMPIPAGRDP